MQTDTVYRVARNYGEAVAQSRGAPKPAAWGFMFPHLFGEGEQFQFFQFKTEEEALAAVADWPVFTDCVYPMCIVPIPPGYVDDGLPIDHLIEGRPIIPHGKNAKKPDFRPFVTEPPVIDEAECKQNERSSQDAHMRREHALSLDKPRQGQHDREAGDEYQERKYQIVETEAFPVDVGELPAQEIADALEHGTVAVCHFAERPSHGIGAEKPENAKSA